MNILITLYVRHVERNLIVSMSFQFMWIKNIDTNKQTCSRLQRSFRRYCRFKSGQTITYTVTNAVNVPAGTKIRLEYANINNPLSPSAKYKVTVTTRNAANAIIDGPTQSTAYTMKQIGTNAIADNSITLSKPAEFYEESYLIRYRRRPSLRMEP